MKQVIDVILSFLFYCLRHGTTFHAVDLLELLQWPNLTSTIFHPQLLPAALSPISRKEII